MGRLTELFSYLNEDTAPTQGEMNVRYSYISKNPELVAMRRKYRRELKADSDEGTPCSAST